MFFESLRDYERMFFFTPEPVIVENSFYTQISIEQNEFRHFLYFLERDQK